MESLGISIYKIMSSVNRHFTSSFYIWMTFVIYLFLIFLFFLIALARTSSTMLTRNDNSGHLCLVLHLGGKAFSFSTVGLSDMAFIMWGTFLLYLVYWVFLSWKNYWIFSNASTFIEMIIYLFLTLTMWKFPCQESNPSYSNNNAKSLTARSIREHLKWLYTSIHRSVNVTSYIYYLGILNHSCTPRINPIRLIMVFDPFNKLLNFMCHFVVDFLKLFIYLFLSFCLFRATPTAYGGSQARGPIRAVAAGLRHSHSNVGSEPSLWPIPQLMSTPDL